jgi:uncharacterized membrane-anchored protein
MGEETKLAIQSKTLWINLAMSVAAFVPVVQTVLTPEIVGAIFGLVNAALRFVTKAPITLKK